MKDRDEFLASVYAKRDAALAKEKKHKKRMMSGLTAAAACLVLMVGLVQADVLDFMGAISGDAAAPELQAMEGITEGNGGNVSAAEDDSAATDSTAEDQIYDGAGVPDSDSAAPGTAAPSAAPEQELVKDIYEIPDEKNRDDADSDSQYYYCLPCATIETYGAGEATVTRTGSIGEVKKVQAWVDGLMEQGQAFTKADAKLDGNADITCIVTIELEPQQKEIYYLTGEVGWYE